MENNESPEDLSSLIEYNYSSSSDDNSICYASTDAHSRLEITEPPPRFARFWKQSEVQKRPANFPSSHDVSTRLRLIKQSGVLATKTVLVECSLYCEEFGSKKKTVHPYRLITKFGKSFTPDTMDPLQIEVDIASNDTVLIEGSILVPGKRSKCKRWPKMEKKNFDKSKCFLGFDCFELNDYGKGAKLCETTFSEAICEEGALSSPQNDSAFDEAPPSEEAFTGFEDSDGRVKLVITQQPEETSYFRNESELNDSRHGCVRGISWAGKGSPKIYPSVKLVGYSGNKDVLIRCTPYMEARKIVKKRILHPYRLIDQSKRRQSKERTKKQIDPYECVVNSKCGYKAHIETCIMIPKEGSVYRRRDMPEYNKEEYDLQKLYLCFNAYEIDDDKEHRICDPVFSTAIGNQRSAATNKLKLFHLSLLSGQAEGNDQITLLCGPVKSDDIQIRFAEIDHQNTVKWSQYGNITRIHHQTAIVFNTPPYKIQNLKESVYVDVQLERKNGDLSNKMQFEYQAAPQTLVHASERYSTPLKRCASPEEPLIGSSDELISTLEKKIEKKKPRYEEEPTDSYHPFLITDEERTQLLNEIAASSQSPMRNDIGNFVPVDFPRSAIEFDGIEFVAQGPREYYSNTGVFEIVAGVLSSLSRMTLNYCQRKITALCDMFAFNRASPITDLDDDDDDQFVNDDAIDNDVVELLNIEAQPTSYLERIEQNTLNKLVLAAHDSANDYLF